MSRNALAPKQRRWFEHKIGLPVVKYRGTERLEEVVVKTVGHADILFQEQQAEGVVFADPSVKKLNLRLRPDRSRSCKWFERRIGKNLVKLMGLTPVETIEVKTYSHARILFRMQDDGYRFTDEKTVLFDKPTIEEFDATFNSLKEY